LANRRAKTEEWMTEQRKLRNGKSYQTAKTKRRKLWNSSTTKGKASK
jgi:hypothetical protein